MCLIVKMDLDDKRSFLLRICDAIGEAESALEGGDFAVAHGALRAAFNGFGTFYYHAKPIPARKTKLNKISNEIFEIRGELVDKIEYHHIKFDKVVDENCIYQRVEANRKLLEKYIKAWYN